MCLQVIQINLIFPTELSKQTPDYTSIAFHSPLTCAFIAFPKTVTFLSRAMPRCWKADVKKGNEKNFSRIK